MLLLEIKNKQGRLGIVHFVGIGGIGMSGIAEIMYNLGYSVQGSDLVENANTKRLKSLGIKIFTEHSAENLHDVSYVVISSAIKPNNPEIIQARLISIPIIKRSEMLAELMRLKSCIAVSGSHGKTTTTSLVACLFEYAGLRPTVINGGIINNRSTNAYLGAGDYLIAEADESDATFIKIPSTIGVITNIDKEHMDYYKSFDNLKAAFKSFIQNLPFYGFGVVCIDDPVVRDVICDIEDKKIITYGIENEDANIRAYNIRLDISSSTFDVMIDIASTAKATILNVTLPVAGKHNVLNSLVAIAIGVELDFGIKVIRDGFKSFEGVKRRFTKVSSVRGVDIIDDYAHHPAEIKATLSTARSIANKMGGRVIAVFQPHRYSRLSNLFTEFSQSFADADRVFVSPVYAAGEQEIQGFSNIELSRAINKAGIKADSFFEPEELVNIFLNNCKERDLFVMMGAGNITSWAQKTANELEFLSL